VGQAYSAQGGGLRGAGAATRQAVINTGQGLAGVVLPPAHAVAQGATAAAHGAGEFWQGLTGTPLPAAAPAAAWPQDTEQSRMLAAQNAGMPGVSVQQDMLNAQMAGFGPAPSRPAPSTANPFLPPAAALAPAGPSQPQPYGFGQGPTGQNLMPGARFGGTNSYMELSPERNPYAIPAQPGPDGRYRVTPGNGQSYTYGPDEPAGPLGLPAAMMAEANRNIRDWPGVQARMAESQRLGLYNRPAAGEVTPGPAEYRPGNTQGLAPLASPANAAAIPGGSASSGRIAAIAAAARRGDIPIAQANAMLDDVATGGQQQYQNYLTTLNPPQSALPASPPRLSYEDQIAYDNAMRMADFHAGQSRTWDKKASAAALAQAGLARQQAQDVLSRYGLQVGYAGKGLEANTDLMKQLLHNQGGLDVARANADAERNRALLPWTMGPTPAEQMRLPYLESHADYWREMADINRQKANTYQGRYEDMAPKTVELPIGPPDPITGQPTKMPHMWDAKSGGWVPIQSAGGGALPAPTAAGAQAQGAPPLSRAQYRAKFMTANPTAKPEDELAAWNNYAKRMGL
jgi:hypothetical protein